MVVQGDFLLLFFYVFHGVGDLHFDFVGGVQVAIVVGLEDEMVVVESEHFHHRQYILRVHLQLDCCTVCVYKSFSAKINSRKYKDALLFPLYIQ